MARTQAILEDSSWFQSPRVPASQARGYMGDARKGGMLSSLKASSESESEVAQSCATLCDPRDCSQPGSSVIFQVSILEWVAILSPGESFQPRNRTCVSWIVDRHFTIWATRESWNQDLTCKEKPALAIWERASSWTRRQIQKSWKRSKDA